MLTSASTINWTGVMMEAKFVVWKMTASVNKVISFRTIPKMSSMPAIAGSPNHQTVIGHSAAFIGVSTPIAYNACGAALPMIYVGKTTHMSDFVRAQVCFVMTLSDGRW